jgi:poly(A) polymerase
MKLCEHIETSVFHLIGTTADKLGIPCYVIGGYVRDRLLNRPSQDIDIVVEDDVINIARPVGKEMSICNSEHHGNVIINVFKTYGTAQLKKGTLVLEFVRARRESYSSDSRNPSVTPGTLHDDQLRRDFTVNTMAICLNADRWGEFVDPFNGLDDLQQKILRTPCDPDITFSDDPLRMLRAIRFATQLNFTITPETLAAITRNASRISIIKQERITEELNKIMTAVQPSIGFMLLEKTTLLAHILPELDRMKGVEVRRNCAHKDNFLHTLKVLDKVAVASDSLWLRWAALLHDVGKPDTKMWDDRLGWTFRNHNLVGSRMIPRIFKRLRLPMGDTMRFVKKLVMLHMRPIVLSEDVVTDSAVRRLLFDAGDDIDELMLLCRCDITSNNLEKVKRFSDNFELVRVKLRELEERDRIRNFQPPITGNEIMDILGLPPCAKVGELKAQLKEAILEGEIANDHDEAYELLLRLADKHGFTIKIKD